MIVGRVRYRGMCDLYVDIAMHPASNAVES